MKSSHEPSLFNPRCHLNAKMIGDALLSPFFKSMGKASAFFLLLLIITGLLLAFHFDPSKYGLHDSLLLIINTIPYGWLVHLVHQMASHFFFLAVYLHLAKAIYTGAYKPPRQSVWFWGVCLYCLMMVTAFTGYVLPWSQTGYWGATVMLNMVQSIPVLGPALYTWIIGGPSLGPETVERFLFLHRLLPMFIVLILYVHVKILRNIICKHPELQHAPLSTAKSSIKDHQNIPLSVFFWPSLASRQIFFLFLILIFAAFVTFFHSEWFTQLGSTVRADPLQTPETIRPEWYFLPFFAFLRIFTHDLWLGSLHIEAKLMGILAMFSSVWILFFLPLLERHRLHFAHMRPLYFILLMTWFAAIFGLGFSATYPPSEMLWLGRVGAGYYFIFLLIICPLMSRRKDSVS